LLLDFFCALPDLALSSLGHGRPGLARYFENLTLDLLAGALDLIVPRSSRPP